MERIMDTVNHVKRNGTLSHGLRVLVKLLDGLPFSTLKIPEESFS